MYSSSRLPRFCAKLDDGAHMTIVAYGDSLSKISRTQAYYGGATAPEKNWKQVLRALFETRVQSEIFVKNLAIGGQGTREAILGRAGRHQTVRKIS